MRGSSRICDTVFNLGALWPEAYSKSRKIAVGGNVECQCNPKEADRDCHAGAGIWCQDSLQALQWAVPGLQQHLWIPHSAARLLRCRQLPRLCRHQRRVWVGCKQLIGQALSCTSRRHLSRLSLPPVAAQLQRRPPKALHGLNEPHVWCTELVLSYGNEGCCTSTAHKEFCACKYPASS